MPPWTGRYIVTWDSSLGKDKTTRTTDAHCKASKFKSHIATKLETKMHIKKLKGKLM